MAVAGFGDPAAMSGLATGVFPGHQPQVGHQLRRGLKATEISQFGEHGHGRDELHPSQGHEGLDHGGQLPGGVIQTRW